MPNRSSWAVFGVVLWLAGCASTTTDSPERGCVSSAQCEAPQVCVEGGCVETACETDRDCPTGTGCASDQCVAGGGSGEASGDAGADATDTATDTAESDAGSGAADTAEEDGSGSGAPIPLDYVTTPADGAVGVALDAQVLIDFNQPMNEIRFTPTTVRVTDYAGAILERQLFYDSATDTLVLSGTETAPLFKPSTPYEVRLSDRLQALDGQMLETPRTFGFATAAAPSAFYAELAEAYAPVLYQEVKTAAVDLPTTVDFDGDANAANNFVGSNGTNRAAVYWTVTESRSHYFVGYWLYYPRVQLNPTAVAEHDWVFAQVIVGKSVDRLGYFVALSTIYHEVYSLFAAEASLYPAGTSVANGASTVDGRLNALEGGRRPSLFVESGRHGVCLPNAGVSASACSPASGATAPFSTGTTGVIARAGATGQRLGDGPPTALTYALVPAVEALWARRASIASDGLFGGRDSYVAPVAGGTTRPGDGTSVPTALSSANAGGSFGDMPFILSHTRELSESGQWVLDPALVFSTELTLAPTIDTNLCFEPFFGLDVRGIDGSCSPPN